MALKFSYTDPATKMRLPNATAVVMECRINYLSGEAHLIVGIWPSPAAREGGASHLLARSFFTDRAEIEALAGKANAGDLRAPAYRWLKKRTPAAGEIDFRSASKE